LNDATVGGRGLNLGRGAFGGKFASVAMVSSSSFLKRQLQLIQKPRDTLRALAITISVQLPWA
jgi:hypothetical protein